MAAILNGLRALGSGRVLDEVLTLVMDSALDVTKAERGFMMLANAEGELEFKIARGTRHASTLPGTSFTTSEKIPREVFQTGQSRIVGDLMEGDLAGQHDGTIAVGIRHVLCVPLLVTPMSAAAPIGDRQRVDRRALSRRPRAQHDAVRSDPRRRSRRSPRRRRWRSKARGSTPSRPRRRASTATCAIAAEIQRALLPEPVFETAYVDLAAASIPCRTVGGDFFDYLEIGERGFGFALGDVAGKGPPAALLAAAVQSNFVAQAPVSADPAETMARINKALLRRAIEARFATMFYGARDRGRASELLQRRPGAAAGRRRRTAWRGSRRAARCSACSASRPTSSTTVTLEPGDLVVVCSDGVTEARNRAGDEFGRDRLVEAMHGRHGAKPEVVARAPARGGQAVLAGRGAGRRHHGAGAAVSLAN